MPPNFTKIHEDKRGAIYLIQDLLGDNKEINLLEIKKGYARGGCYHSNNENFVVIKGKVKFICGDKEKKVSKGESGEIPAFQPHAFIALEDSIVSEWGITTEEKEKDTKDPKLREIIDKINNK